MDFIDAFLAVTLIHLLAAASPGPDFVMVSQQSLVRGKRAGLLCSLGIALGLSVHITYSSLGMAALVSESAFALSLLKYLAAAYLIWLGISGLRSRASGPDTASSNVPSASPLGLMTHGFICNALNPKAPLYFLSVFTLLITPLTPLWQILLLGGWMMLLQFGWFALVTLVLSRPTVRARFNAVGHWVDRVLGGVMLAFGAGLLLSDADSLRR